MGLNNHGDVVGYEWNNSGIEEAALWTAGATTPISLNNPITTGCHDFVWALNDAGDSTGYSINGNAMSGGSTFEDAVYWNSAGTSTVLATLDNEEPYSLGQCINNNGEIGGESGLMLRNGRATARSSGTVRRTATSWPSTRLEAA